MFPIKQLLLIEEWVNMTKKIVVERNLAGLEDLLFGVGTEMQVRDGLEVPVTKINAKNLPFDELSNLGEILGAIIIELTDGYDLDTLYGKDRVGIKYVYHDIDLINSPIPSDSLIDGGSVTVDGDGHVQP